MHHHKSTRPLEGDRPGNEKSLSPGRRRIQLPPPPPPEVNTAAPRAAGAPVTLAKQPSEGTIRGAATAGTQHLSEGREGSFSFFFVFFWTVKASQDEQINIQHQAHVMTENTLSQRRSGRTLVLNMTLISQS